MSSSLKLHSVIVSTVIVVIVIIIDSSNSKKNNNDKNTNSIYSQSLHELTTQSTCGHYNSQY